MDVEAFRKAGHRAIEEVAAYYERLQKGSAGDGFQVAPDMRPGDVIRQISSGPPIEGEDFDKVQDAFEDIVLPATCHWQHPSFFAYFPANSTFESIIADIYSTATSTPGFNHSCNPAATEIEQAMTNWVGQMLGLDESFCNNGVIQTTASEAVIVATVAARERALRLIMAKPENADRSRSEVASRLIMYGSTQTHSLGAKAGLVLDIPFKAIPSSAENNWALTGKDVSRILAEDAEKGLIPFMLIATIGTTSSGAIDHIADICQATSKFPEVFVHVDAAWAGVYLALPDQRGTLRLNEVNKRGPTSGLDTFGEVHSFCTNLHKSGLVAFDASCYFIRDSKLLTEILDVTPPFLRNHGSKGQVTDYRNWGLSLGRRFRSLKIMFVLRSYGLSGFQQHIQRSIDLAKHFECLLKLDDRFALVTPRSLALVVFRLQPTAGAQNEEKLNQLNRDLYAALHAFTSLQLTSTIIGDTFCIRMAIGSRLTRQQHVDEAWLSIKRVADNLLS